MNPNTDFMLTRESIHALNPPRPKAQKRRIRRQCSGMSVVRCDKTIDMFEDLLKKH